MALQVAQTRAAMVARGYDAVTAGGLALKMLGGRVARQAMVIAFDKSFLLQGILFLAILPLLYFLRVQKRPGARPLELPVE